MTKGEKQVSMDEVAKHTTQESCWMIIGNEKTGGPKVYNVTKYLDDHPGGAEVLLDVAGQDADEFFEDIGHSLEARKELAKYYVGDLQMDEKARAARAAASKSTSSSDGSAVVMIGLLVLIVGGAAAYFLSSSSSSSGTAEL